MAQLARISVAAAVACPHCQTRLNDLPLDELAAGRGYCCPHCSQALQIPAALLERLIAQREELAKHLPSEPLSWWQRWLAWLGIGSA